jgi:hypothetical protein
VTVTSEPEVLAGGVANAGAVVRVGQHVLRPSSPQTPQIHALLRWVRDHGFDGVPEPIGVDPDGRERLVYIGGDVPLPPFPSWAQTDEALASIAHLLRRYHEAAAGFEAAGASWNTEMADVAGGQVVCHNDVCLENVVFRDGVAVALLDFEFAAPGRPVYDLACMTRMCVPVDDAAGAAVFGFEPPDVGRRLRVAADAYGLGAAGRGELFDILAGSIARGGEFVLRRVEEGHPAFIEMWEKGGGMARFDRRRAWFAEERDRIASALA